MSDPHSSEATAADALAEDATQESVTQESVARGDQPPMQLRVRRAPRFSRFIALGAVLGLAIAILVVAVRPEGADAQMSARALYGFLGTIFAMLGALLGALIGVLLDRRG